MKKKLSKKDQDRSEELNLILLNHFLAEKNNNNDEALLYIDELNDLLSEFFNLCPENFNYKKRGKSSIHIPKLNIEPDGEMTWIMNVFDIDFDFMDAINKKKIIAKKNKRETKKYKITASQALSILFD